MPIYDNVSVFFDGDPDGATQYVPLAVQLTRRLKERLRASGVVLGFNTFYAAEATLLCSCNDGKLSVIIKVPKCALYLETGQLDVGNFAPQDPLRHTPGTWHLGDIPASTTWLGSVSLAGVQLGGAPVSGQDSASLGWSSGVVNPSLQMQNALELKKACVRYCPPSLFSGKLRLYVQSIYGARFNKDWPWEVVTTGQPYLRHRGVGAELANKNQSTVLHTDVNGNYFLLSLIGTTIRMYKLTLSPCGDSLRQYLLVPDTALTRAQRSVVEAYALADASVGQGLVLTTAFDNLSSFAYGWAANWDGSRISIVAQGVGGSGGATYYTGRTVTWSIERLSNVDFSAVTDEDQQEKQRWKFNRISDGTATPWLTKAGRLYVWGPQYLEHDFKLQLGYLSSTSTTQFQNAPVHCYYDDTDTLVECKVSWHSASSPATLELVGFSAKCPLGGGLWFAANASVSRSARAATTNIFSSVSIGEYSKTLSTWSAISGRGYTVSRTGGDETFPVGSGYNVRTEWEDVSDTLCGVDPGGFESAVSLLEDAEGTYPPEGLRLDLYPEYNTDKGTTPDYRHESGNENELGTVCLVIPLFDCEAAYCVSSRQTVRSGTYTLGWTYAVTGASGALYKHAIETGHLFTAYDGDSWYSYPAVYTTNVIYASDTGFPYTLSSGGGTYDEDTTHPAVVYGSNRYGALALVPSTSIPLASIIAPELVYPYSSTTFDTYTSAGGRVVGKYLVDNAWAAQGRTFSGGA